MNILKKIIFILILLVLVQSIINIMQVEASIIDDIKTWFSKTSNVLEENEDSQKIYGEYVSNGYYLQYIEEQTSVEQFIKKANLNEANIKIMDTLNKEKKNPDIITTGSKIQMIFDTGMQEYTAVVIGDINGDGKANIKDLLQMNKYRLGKNKLENEYLMASDVDYSKTTDIKDILKINKYRLRKIDTLLPTEIEPIEVYFSANKTDSTKYISIVKGETETVEANIEPTNANTNNSITYSLSGNSKVASVDSKTGKITANQAGVMTLKAKTENGKEATININVRINNKAVEQSALTSTANDSIYSECISPYKDGDTTMHMQSFDIDSKGAIYYAGTCLKTEQADASYYSHFYKASSKNERPTENGMTLLYNGHESAIDVEEEGDTRYIWGEAFASKKFTSGFQNNYGVSRIKYENNKKIIFGPGTVTEKDSNKEVKETYKNDEDDTFVYYNNSGNMISNAIKASVDEDNRLLCLYFRTTAGANVYIFDLDEALALPNEKHTDIQIEVYKDPSKSSDTVTEYLDFFAKNLGFKLQSDGTYKRNIVPLATLVINRNDIIGFQTSAMQGFDIDGDYLYIVEGNEQPTNITAFDYMYSYNGKKTLFERTMVEASITEAFYSKMGNYPLKTYEGKQFYETEGIKVKDGKVFCGYMSRCNWGGT